MVPICCSYQFAKLQINTEFPLVYAGCNQKRGRKPNPIIFIYFSLKIIIYLFGFFIFLLSSLLCFFFWFLVSFVLSDSDSPKIQIHVCTTDRDHFIHFFFVVSKCFFFFASCEMLFLFLNRIGRLIFVILIALGNVSFLDAFVY